MSTADILRAANWSSEATSTTDHHLIRFSPWGTVRLTLELTTTLVSFKQYHVVNYVVGGYLEPPKYNYRFLKDCSNLMRRMNCMRRCRIPGDNIVSSHPVLPVHPSYLPLAGLSLTTNTTLSVCHQCNTLECIHASVYCCKCCLYIHSDYCFLSVTYTDVKYGCMDLPLKLLSHFMPSQEKKALRSCHQDLLHND